MTSYGQELKRIRRACMVSSQDDLARRTGLARQTIALQERSPTCRMHQSTVLLVLRALREAPRPITADDSLALGLPAGLTRDECLQYASSSPGQQSTSTAQAAFTRLASQMGAERLATILLAVESGLHAATRPDRSMIHKSKPMQREGYVEEVEVEYHLPDPPPEAPHRAAV